MTATDPITTDSARRNDTWLRRPLALGFIPATLLLTAVLLLAAGLHFYQLSALGDSNLYYTAAVKSMTQSWHNFFFVSAEPGGSVSVDKPPLGLWIETAFALLLGVNGLAVMLPNILAGLISIPLIYHIVQPRYGVGAALVSALALALTPVSLAAQRNNTADGLLTLCLLLAAWGFLKATETGRSRYLWLGAVLVGLGFNIKMLQAFLPLPAFYTVYLLGAPTRLGRKIGNLALATLGIAVVSLAWAAAVDLTPADQRPYVGSSAGNSVLELALGYNGWQRLIGPTLPGVTDTADGGLTLPPGNRLPLSGNRPPGMGLPGPGGRPGGPQEVGERGIGRFFIAPMSKELSWLLPFALVSGVALALTRRPTWPLSPDHQAVTLWGGWLLTGLVFFSLAGFFHAYYLVMLAPPLAVLTGIGVSHLWQGRVQPRRATWALAGGTGLTIAFQAWNAQQFAAGGWWLALAALIWALGAWLWLARRNAVQRLIGLALLPAAMLVMPFIWSVLTVTTPASTTLPAAYAGATAETPGNFPFDQRNTLNEELLTYLQARTQNVKYLLAVTSSMEGASYVLASGGRPVLYMGGFNGSDKVVSAENLADLVANGDVRYVLQGGTPAGPGAAGGDDIRAWVSEHCTPVEEINLTQDLPVPASPLPGVELFSPRLMACGNG